MLTYRRLRVLLRHLPPESAFAQSYTGSTWSQTDYILADLYDLIAATVKWKQAPSTYPRPGKSKGRRFRGTPMTIEEIKRKREAQDGR